MAITKVEGRARRKLRIRKKVEGNAERRFTLLRSLHLVVNSWRRVR